MALEFEWDPAKELKNIRKNGISFTTAREVFSDPNQFVSENYEDDFEQRYQIIGMTQGLVLLLVVFVDRSADSREVVRIIQARKAEAFEVSLYEDQIS